MDAEIPVLSGHLIVPTQSGFSINRISKKKSSNLKYCLLFSSSRHGIERLEICDSKEDIKNSKIITLENCVKITQDPEEKLINIVTKTGTLQLNTQNEDDLTNWVTVLKSVAFRDKTTVNRNSIEQDNDLYCSSFNDGIFNVKLIDSETTERCKLEAGNYILELASTELQLKKTQNETIVVVKWPYRFIRKYGYRDGNFTFEAGRKCDTGEGIFRLDNPNPKQIFRCMSAKMKTMKKLIKGESFGNLVDSCENQLNVAISMEAGSRSPIPTSQNNSMSSDFDVSLICSPLNQSHASVRGFISSNDSLNATSPTTNNPSTTINNNYNINNNNVKPIPNKPPRQAAPRAKFSNYEPIAPLNTITTTTTTASTTSVLKPIKSNNINPLDPSNLTLIIPTHNRDYECINHREEAWRTLGENEVFHTEHITTPEDDLIEFLSQRAKSLKKLSSPQSQPTNLIGRDTAKTTTPPPLPPQKLAINDINGAYDKLDFFGSNSKVSPTYKTIINVPPSLRKQISQPITSNDYELIGGPDTQPCRMADDSYLGYGVLRKPSLPGGQICSSTQTNVINEDEILDHRTCNGLDYAIVSKPKRV